MALVKRFIAYYRPHKLLFGADMAASLLISLLGMVYPVMTNRLLNDFIPNRAYRSILIAGSVVLLLYLVRMLLRYFVQYQGHMVGTYMQAQMRRELFAHLERLPFSFFDDHETGAIMTRMTNDLFEVSELAHHGPENLLTCTVMILLSFGYLCTINVWLTLIIFACVPLLTAVSEVGNQMYIDACASSYSAMGKFHSATSFITDVFNVIILIAGGLFLYKGSINFGEYSTFIVSVNLFIAPVQTLIQFMEQWQNGATGFRRFIEIMDIPEEQDDPGAVDIGEVQGEIELRDVSFSYEKDGRRDVLEHVSLGVGKGAKMAKDIRSVTMESLRRNIGIVQQDVFLFAGTIRDNIAYGNPEATDEQILDAAKKANLHEFVSGLPDGYDTEIGERGIRLSGGQKQRVSIARVFLKNPSILILDEATSALDNTTEVLIQQSLDELCKGRTTLVVAHRLSTIRNADHIAVVTGGRITESGTHDELMKGNGTYRELYELQFRNS